MKLATAITICLVGGLLASCRASLASVDDTVARGVARVDHAVEKATQRVDSSVHYAKGSIDDSMAQAETRIQRSIQSAQAAVQTTILKVRDEYEGAVASTSEEVTKLREEFKADLDDLETKLEERLEQVRLAALEVVAAGDAAVEARIDQIFTELRLFMTETLKEIRELITPVLELAKTLDASVREGNVHITRVSEEMLKLVAQLQGVFTEVQGILLKVQGKQAADKDGDSGSNGPDGWFGLMTAIVALGTSLATQWKRSADHKRDGERWKPEELKELVKTSVEDFTKQGQFDDEFRGRLVHLGVLTTKTHAELEALSRGNGDCEPDKPGG